jgi:hypothetical protein
MSVKEGAAAADADAARNATHAKSKTLPFM